jgi:hypothetical protein
LAVERLAECLGDFAAPIEGMARFAKALDAASAGRGLTRELLDPAFGRVADSDQQHPGVARLLDYAEVLYGGAFGLRQLFEFAVWLARLARQDQPDLAAALRRTIDGFDQLEAMNPDRLARIRTEINNTPTEVRRHALVRINPHDPEYPVVLWRYDSARSADVPRPSRAARGRVEYPEYRVLETELHVREAVAEVLLSAGLLTSTSRRNAARDDIPVVEVMLPWPKDVPKGGVFSWPDLTTPVEDWLVAVRPGRSPRQLGRLVPVVVRPWPEPEGDLTRRRTSWHRLHQPGSQVDLVGYLDADAADPYDGRDWLCAVLGERVKDMIGALKKARQAGIPVAVWCRADPSGTARMPDRIAEMIDEVFNRRIKGRGCKLTIVWDDPHWMPRGLELAYEYEATA